MATLDDVQADVTAQTTVVASAVTLLQGLSAQLAAAIASGDLTKIQAIKDGIDANTTTLAKINASKPTLAPFAEAAKYSWFVPSTPNWANVESQNVLQNMLTAILRHPSQTQQLAHKASQQITDILNT